MRRKRRLPVMPHNNRLRLILTWRSGLFGVDAAGELLLPGPETRLTPTTFDTWLTGQSATALSGS